ncbi:MULTISPECIES: hypothetical protein [Ralstonia]|uniref:Type III effector protein n=1 Tax=Ralstonia mojiangensis TaxID=2953895 RepID=A0ABT2L9L1_9RALS|nr:hypothetical protein [Ralstonia mojiangensis]MCO5414701.1 hypothetical protein [Ralstonia mojiangensis]MCT7297767.1 hypothetical protein [Ralstonia mojiangensis]MCT7312105.1 hypothetical protein [Ralstonia mojiangensis]
MGLCISKPTTASVNRTHDTQPIPAAATQHTGHERARNARQAGGHLGELGNLNRNRAASGAGTSSLQTRRTAALPSLQHEDPSPRQAAVASVLTHVRETYYKPNLKSGNKVKGDTEAERLRQQLATDEVNRIRSQPNALLAVQEGKAHQCQELALLAVYHLCQEHKLPAKILELGGNDVDVAHCVAVVGLAPHQLHSNMKLWHPDTYICDPWCNIACRAKDYPKQFIDKMEKWESQGKLVGYPPMGFVQPIEPAWIRDVLRGDRTVSDPLGSQSP